MKVKENLTNYLQLAEDCEGIMADLEEVKRKLRRLRGELPYSSNIVAILDSYVVPYIDGILGGGQIMMSLDDVLTQLNDNAMETLQVESLDGYCIPEDEEDALYV